MTSEQIYIGNMSHETAIGILKLMLKAMETYDGISPTPARINAIKMAIEALDQEPTTKNNLEVEYISRSELMAILSDYYDTTVEYRSMLKEIAALPSVTPQEPKTGHCKDCKWWKDSDGAYRRGVGAESQCPINRREVFDGNGYCYIFDPQESEDKE